MDPEIKRKALHLVAAAVPVLLMYLPAHTAAPALTGFALCNLLLDLCRPRYPLLGRVYGFFFADILREHEHKGLTGATYYFLSLTLSYLVFGLALSLPVQYIVLAYTGFMAGDAAAALIGAKLGRIRIRGGKSLEGSLAFLAACLLSTAWIMPDRWILLILSAAGLTLAELFLTRVDDNFCAPLLLTLAFALLL
ncbi:diacylglycerol/polyprenol kinase family protein [Desulfovermiculus halophilus]|jgi:dolichol kinase|uniref:diacylglycerol/polyprenol kinase family protein n=1 Tax=Desulfovermiculus halophilus TaxID=339722 RepID=UPI0004860A49|nr:hypothetical protein [Desulfovermiculus halophilus]